MEFSQFFNRAPDADAHQATSQPASPNNTSAPGTQVPMNLGDHAVTVSWVGILIALILLRIVYEVSE